MSIQVALHHETTYRYDRLVQMSPHVIRLRPAPHCRTPIVSYSIKVSPEKQFLNWQQDPYNNYLARLIFPEPTKEFKVTVDLIASLTVINPFDFYVEEYAENFPFAYDPIAAKELIPYLETEPTGPKLQAIVNEVREKNIRTVDYLVKINQHLQQRIEYGIRLEPGLQTCEETLTKNRGACRDTAWLQVQILRHLGLAARFVSGYLIQLKPDVKPLDGPHGAENDFTDLHAWTEVYIPGAGWVGLDPTSGLLAGEGHIPLACTADPVMAAAVTGSFTPVYPPREDQPKEVKTDFGFAMSVQRVVEPPRVTKPYTEEQWQAIEQLGHYVDEHLEAGDVRLTMGGEPTFVSIDDMQGEEWTTSALGPTKRRLAGELLRRLQNKFSPGALLHYGQGKWYPGEPLPRWALGCYWRKDSVPVWNDLDLIASEEHKYSYGEKDAHDFISTLANKLAVQADHILPGFEDVWYYLWKERRLPANVDPLNSKLEDKMERLRLARIFEQGLGKVVGYVLPIDRWWINNRPKWVSGKWFFRQEHMFLLPGDSPMGLRLPLESLPWYVPGDRLLVAEADASDAPTGPLHAGWNAEERNGRFDRRPWPLQQQIVARTMGRGTGNGQQRTSASQQLDEQLLADPTSVIKTALCVEPRDQHIYVFLPPTRCLEDYLDLVRAVEETAAELQMPVLVEGYTPPSDPRLLHFSVTPDPGVIEVNIHPSASWQELVEKTTILYEEARQTRLATEKFMLDGRHTGTGGGNHILIGGPTTNDSPVLRRPDVLRSLVSYWHNHPSLSYLFSGMFLGPTSQAPRIDEARNDSLYELEIACQQLPENSPVPPWLTDRLFRNLLIDVTGNTHRAEFCIDKLYSPDSSSGRRGLVEMRAFEMPPHSRMSLVQHLLLRALIARFWESPYQAKLVRWGTELHDRYCLPHFVWQDFQDVLTELRQTGYDFAPEWFRPHLEFRFPVIGTVNRRDVVMELRHAIEPWHVLGEEVSAFGTARYVDSSVERLQVVAQNLVSPRHVILCNGRRVPLHPTGVNGEYVGGVRYRAWQPPSCLHPTIGIHSPLVIEVVDTWMNWTMGGCTYHVEHPGGRNTDQFPVNAFEAESRRVARFFKMGHTPGPINVPEEERNPEMPLTLDLRKRQYPAPQEKTNTVASSRNEMTQVRP